MKRLATAILTTTLIVAAWPGMVASAATTETTEPMGFGIHANSVKPATEAGAKPDYGVFWVGPWTLKSGWGGPDSTLDSLRAQGVTPAIHFYYWGDDISQSCLEYGCWSNLHGAQKDKQGWQTLAQQTVDHLNARMGGEPVVIFMETEFNKADVQYYEPLDGYLAEKAAFIKNGYPNAEIVMSLGSWNRGAWSTWDRTAAASDMVGIQGMRGSTRDSYSHYHSLYETTLGNAQYLQKMYDKPIFIQDLALSSYPEPTYLDDQASELKEFFDGMGALKQAGVQALAYRTWEDNPNMDLANYYGYAERHWGFQMAYSGPWKPSAQVWIDGVQAERAGAAPPSGGSDFTASFAPHSNSNEWWVQVGVQSNSWTKSVQASYNGGSWVSLQKQAWGDWAASFHAPAGGQMVFRATDSYGQTFTAAPITWLQAPGPEPESNTPPVASFTATVSGDTVTLDASPSSDAEGDPLTYKWSFGDGSYATGVKSTHQYKDHGSYQITLTVSDGSFAKSVSKKVTIEPSEFTATFKVHPNSNQWWVQLGVASWTEPAKVQASHNGGPWMDLQKSSWGDWTRSYHVPAGEMAFRAITADGKTYTADPVSWLGGTPNQAPKAAFSHNVDGQTVRFDASTSSDPDGDALSYIWQFGDGTTAAGAKVSHSYAPGDYVAKLTVSDGMVTASTTKAVTVQQTAPFTATFKPHQHSNEWWVQVGVDASSTPKAVQASYNGGAWQTLELKPWGHYAASFHAPAGGKMVFRAISADGQTVTSDPMTWLKSSPAPGLDASFAPVTQTNSWWIEVKATSDQDIRKVTATLDGKETVTLDKTSWGTWAKRVPVGNGADVVFTATSASGQTDTSGTYRWG